MNKQEMQILKTGRVIAGSYLFADQETASYCQTMGEVVNAVSQKI